MISPSKFGTLVASLWRLLEKQESLSTKIEARAAQRPVTREQRKQVLAMCRKKLPLNRRVLAIFKQLLGASEELQSSFVALWEMQEKQAA
jgi:hypothetical protein